MIFMTLLSVEPLERLLAAKGKGAKVRRAVVGVVAAAALASDPRSAASDALEEMVGLMIRARMRGKVDEVLSLPGAAGAASGLMRELGAALKKN